MALEVVTSWQTLMQLAYQAGQARLRHSEEPSAESERDMNEAIKRHDDYRDMCLKADRMIGLDGLL